MSETTITQLPDPSGFTSYPFTDVLRDGARKLIEQAIHAELATLMAAFSGERLDDGRARLVRHGHLPERDVMTGIGPVPVPVKVPRVRDRGIGEDKITFIRTSNPIESTFATVRHRTKRTKGCLSRKTGLAMAFKLMMSAQKKWRKLDGQNRLPEIIQGVEFRDGIRQLQAAA